MSFEKYKPSLTVPVFYPKGFANKALIGFEKQLHSYRSGKELLEHWKDEGKKGHIVSREEYQQMVAPTRTGKLQVWVENGKVTRWASTLEWRKQGELDAELRGLRERETQALNRTVQRFSEQAEDATERQRRAEEEKVAAQKEVQRKEEQMKALAEERVRREAQLVEQSKRMEEAERRLTSEQLTSKLHAQKVIRLEEDLKAKQKEMQEAEENSNDFQQALLARERELKRLRSSTEGNSEQIAEKEAELREMQTAMATAEKEKEELKVQLKASEEEAQSTGSEYTQQIEHQQGELYNLKTAANMVEKLIEKKLLNKLEAHEEFERRPFGEVDKRKICRLLNLPEFDGMLAVSSFQEGLWRNPNMDRSALEDELDKAQRQNSMPPFVAACVFKAKRDANGAPQKNAQGYPEYEVREEDETMVIQPRQPPGFSSPLPPTIVPIRADFVRWLRRQHKKRADDILESLKATYSEMNAHNLKADAITYKLWNKRTNKEMTPKEKIIFVLQNVGGCMTPPRANGLSEMLIGELVGDIHG